MTTGFILAGLLILVSLGGGLLMKKNGKKLNKRWFRYSYIAVNVIVLVAILVWGAGLIFPHMASAATATSGQAVSGSGNGLGFIAAGLAVGLASIGAGIAVGIAGSAAMGAISEKPELLGRTLIIVGLAEGIAIYGLIISIMILGRL